MRIAFANVQLDAYVFRDLPQRRCLDRWTARTNAVAGNGARSATRPTAFI
ncbi:hypothetical protein [Xanthomonas vasicola]|nr:hypothetical protein [Xanthomonas vasicola]